MKGIDFLKVTASDFYLSFVKIQIGILKHNYSLLLCRDK